ncbi:isopropylmalate/homocitrate/citramalate synthase [Clostridium beijerinckii]|uniref:(R)-citramalate synthase n=1 Tax=Clostridium beijerinckii TaxID=1520 RepID=A0AAE5LT50_CLOBE|nr:isopropylmalate/homocitrate/citramalate synthase [Clostridium beijerinckii]
MQNIFMMDINQQRVCDGNFKGSRRSRAKVVVLCDTNGGALPQEIYSITKTIKETVKVELGIHSHDDMGMAVANSIMAVEAGASQIQGTFIGIGERCGNANLSTIIPTLKLKLGYKVLNDNELVNLTKTSRYIAEICNITLSDEDPF